MTQSPPSINIRHVFSQHEILLTGANGFLGKVILGLLLNRFPSVKHIHILLRPKGDLSAEERFYTEVLASPALADIVDKLTAKHGEEYFKTKLTIWPGDIAQPNCGLQPHEVEKLVGRVGLALNCAGLVEFFPAVDDCFAVNAEGVENIAGVARSLSAKLLHVSTCYVCGEADGLIEETEPILGFYPHRTGTTDQSFNHVEEMQHCRERIRQIYLSAQSARPASPGSPFKRTREIKERLVTLGKQRAAQWGWVNTYTYSKSIGEQIIASAKDLCSCIVRPAIVESAVNFPFPGWIEGGRTAAPLVLMALGGLKDWPVREDIPLEVVPVDFVASAILVISALLLEGRHKPVYQLATADVNPILMGGLVRLLDDEARRRSRNGHRRSSNDFIQRLVGAGRGRVRAVSVAEAQESRVRLESRIKRAEGWLNTLQSSLLRGNASVAGWKAGLRALKLQARLREQTLGQYLPFILQNRFVFECENIRAAYELISEEDRKSLPWQPERIDWRDYWINHQIPGIQRWVQPDAVKDWQLKI